jgi:hypothetical protein
MIVTGRIATVALEQGENLWVLHDFVPVASDTVR